jgi:hypothetical protein
VLAPESFSLTCECNRVRIGMLTGTPRRAAMLTAKECLQSADVCLALAHKTKELETRAVLLEFAYELRTVAKCLERDERKLMVRAASDGTQKHGYKRLGSG